MVFVSIEQAITSDLRFADRLKKLRLIATDMDGTLTQQGKFTGRQAARP
jgi:hypothetical protein